MALRDPDPGLELVESGYLTTRLSGNHFAAYPPGPVVPIAGQVVTTGANDSKNQLALGIRVPAQAGKWSEQGVWVDYHVGSDHFRTMLFWLLNVCSESVATSCDAPDTAAFSPPPEYQAP